MEYNIYYANIPSLQILGPDVDPIFLRRPDDRVLSQHCLSVVMYEKKLQLGSCWHN